MAGEARTADPAAERTAFELERFECAGERLELSGHWHGVRGRRFVRPTLTVQAGGEPQRLLALLDHKPWAAEDDPWVAAFAWKGDGKAIEGAELSVAPGLDVQLPKPRPAKNGGKSAKRAGLRFEANGDGTLVAADDNGAADAGADGAPIARRPKRAPRKGSAAARVKELEEELAAVRLELAAALEEQDSARGERHVATSDRDKARAELAAMKIELDDVVRARDAQTAERAELLSRIEILEAERDAARNEAEDARAQAANAREAAHAETEELRAAARREAEETRDVAEREVEAARQAIRGESSLVIAERDKAFAQRDQAFAEIRSAEADRDAALRARDEAIEERDIARRERDAAPLHPGFVALRENPAESPLAVWTPRLIGAGLLFLFALVVITLFKPL